MYHSAKVLSGGKFETQDMPGTRIFPEERLGFIHAYKNQGLYSSSTINFRSQITFYQSQCINLSDNMRYVFKWSDFIYKIPRRW